MLALHALPPFRWPLTGARRDHWHVRLARQALEDVRRHVRTPRLEAEPRRSTEDQLPNICDALGDLSLALRAQCADGACVQV